MCHSIQASFYKQMHQGNKITPCLTEGTLRPYNLVLSPSQGRLTPHLHPAHSDPEFITASFVFLPLVFFSFSACLRLTNPYTNVISHDCHSFPSFTDDSHFFSSPILYLLLFCKRKGPPSLGHHFPPYITTCQVSPPAHHLSSFLAGPSDQNLHQNSFPLCC